MARESSSKNASSSPSGGGEQLAVQVLAKLRERILAWHYPPGHHLGEQALCEEFNASRIPVREALRALAEQGLVDKVPNMGCYVKQLNVKETQQLYDMRLALELFVMEALIQRGVPPDLLAAERAYWEPLLALRANDPVDGDELVRADERFHFRLAEALGNTPILDALDEINARLRFVRLVVITTTHRVAETAGEHLAILDALERKDVESARKSLRQNLNHARNKVELAIASALMRAHQRS
jgi:DNA-binding GntR family transcriptional regulator